MASDFLDKLAASVSRTTRGVSDSLRTMSDKSRINKDIAAIEHELRARYQEIGEKYYSANADNPDSEYAEVFASVRELMDALDVRRRDLDALVGSFSCASCGKQLTKGAKFCPYCGVGVPDAELSALRKHALLRAERPFVGRAGRFASLRVACRRRQSRNGKNRSPDRNGQPHRRRRTVL